MRRSQNYRKLRSQGRSAFISDIFLTPDEAKAHPAILLDMTDDAFIAYDKNDFLKTVLGEMKRNLRKLGAKKVKTVNATHPIFRIFV